MKRFIVMLVGISALGCKETPKKAWEEMQEAACERDVPAFFARVDKTAMTNAAIQSVSKEGPTALVESIALRETQRGFTSWEDEIKKGEGGDWCRATFKEEDQEKGVARWTTPSGRTKGARFADAGGKLMMVEMVD